MALLFPRIRLADPAWPDRQRSAAVRFRRRWRLPPAPSPMPRAYVTKSKRWGSAPHIPTHAHRHIQTHTYTYSYIYTHTYTHAHIYIHTYIRSRTRTHTFSLSFSLCSVSLTHLLTQSLILRGLIGSYHGQLLVAAAKDAAAAQLAAETQMALTPSERTSSSSSSSGGAGASGGSGANARRQEMEQQVKILTLEKELTNARRVLATMRKVRGTRRCVCVCVCV
jgi:hypothetical protein